MTMSRSLLALRFVCGLTVPRSKWLRTSDMSSQRSTRACRYPTCAHCTTGSLGPLIPRVLTFVALLFAMVAALLGAVGVYSVLADIVSDNLLRCGHPDSPRRLPSGGRRRCHAPRSRADWHRCRHRVTHSVDRDVSIGRTVPRCRASRSGDVRECGYRFRAARPERRRGARTSLRTHQPRRYPCDYVIHDVRVVEEAFDSFHSSERVHEEMRASAFPGKRSCSRRGLLH